MSKELLNKDVLNLVDRIYDTALDPLIWPELMLEIAHRLGAIGAMIIEVTLHDEKPILKCAYHSVNYDRAVLDDYFHRHNSQELEDQHLFAQLTSAPDRIELVDDVSFLRDKRDFESRANIKEMMGYGIKHRSGTLLNKDSWQIDRFAVQYSADRGPSTAEEKELARLILPSLAKTLRIGRPLLHARNRKEDLQKRLDSLPFGTCVISAGEKPILTNIEFDRILDEHPFFWLSQGGHLRFDGGAQTDRFNKFLKSTKYHATSGSMPRKESIFVPTDAKDSGLFIEMSPIDDNPELGSLPSGSRLLTVLDTSVPQAVSASAISRFFALSPKEKKVLELMAAGHSNKQIAEKRNRDVETINSQVKKLYQKTYTKNRTELVQLALSLEKPFSVNWMG